MHLKGTGLEEFSVVLLFNLVKYSSRWRYIPWRYDPPINRRRKR